MRILVTGMGIVSPLGIGVPDFWAACLAGRSGIGAITRFDASAFPCARAGEVRPTRQDPWLDAHPRPDPAVRFALDACAEALADAGLADGAVDPATVGVVLSTNFGGADAGERLLTAVSEGRLPDAADAAAFAYGGGADLAASRWMLAGPRATLSLSCSSGTAALAYGMNLIRAGRAAVVLAGGYDAVSRFAWSGLGALRTMTSDELRPFDLNRSGTLFSEGAGVLVLEDAGHARRRGAPVYAELCGAALNNNAHHMTAPAKEGEGTARVIRAALADAGMAPEAIDHINAHGTGTKHNDVTETQAIKAVFGAHARRMPITSLKSMTGHMMGAAGSAEAIATVLSLRDGVVPPTINFQTPDPECDLDVVFNTPRRATITTALSNSAGIGGCNAAAVFRKAEA